MNKKELAKFIDHTLLKQDATEEEVRKLCSEALEYSFASVCINPSYVSLAAQLLKHGDVKVCTVIGFPLGATTTAVKAFEAQDAVNSGAEEVDMVINIGKLKDKDYEYVRRDIEAVVKATEDKAITKVIIETCLLNEDEKIMACKLAKEAKADFVKTSTGFSKAGANVKDISLMREIVGNSLGVKASGGVRTYEDAIAMIESGASRIGASSSVSIVNHN